MNYKQLVKDLDFYNPDEVVCKLNEILTTDESAEKKLFAVGLILDKNKEGYINELKKQLGLKEDVITKLHDKCRSLATKNEKTLVTNNKLQVKNKKKVIVVRKRTEEK